MWSVIQVQNQLSSFANELRWANKGRTCSVNWPVVQTEANNDKDVSINDNSSIYSLTPSQGLSFNFYPGWPTMENTWLKWSATVLTINEDIWHEYTKTHDMLSKIRRLCTDWRINQEEHLWDSRETMVNSAAICGPVLPYEISNPNKSWKKCCLLVRKLFSGHILGIYCAPVVRHPFL